MIEEGSTEDFTGVLRVFGNARQLNSHNLDKYFVLRSVEVTLRRMFYKYNLICRHDRYQISRRTGEHMGLSFDTPPHGDYHKSMKGSKVISMFDATIGENNNRAI